MGSCLVGVLGGAGWQVVPLVRRSSGFDNEVMLDFCDVDFRGKLALLPKVDAVVHLGARIGWDGSTREELFKPNVLATAELADWSKSIGSYFLFSMEHLLLPNGIVFIVVPNDFSVLQNLLMQTVLKDKPDKQNYWVCPPEHLNYWLPKTIIGFLQKCGFEIEFLTTDFPMEIFPLMGEDYITKPDVGRNAHLKRVSFEKYLNQAHAEEFKDSLYLSLAQLGIGRDIYVIAKPV